jgi:hypothetical protein
MKHGRRPNPSGTWRKKTDGKYLTIHRNSGAGRESFVYRLVNDSHGELWTWAVYIDGKMVASGDGKNERHAKKWCDSTLDRWGDRRPNPGSGTWVTARGEHISAGDTIAFRVPAGMGRRGRDWKVVEAKVQRLLVFDDHVVAKYGSSGAVVDDTHFVNLVRKASRANPLFGPKRDLQHYLVTDRRSGNWLSVVEGTDLVRRAEKHWKQQGFKTASKKISEGEAEKRGIGHRQFNSTAPLRVNPILSVISNPLLSIASNPARRRRRKRR